MWLALVLPLLVLPALIVFSRFEQRMLRGGAPAVAPAAPAAPVAARGARPGTARPGARPSDTPRT
jgi:hypothetical protein